MKPNQSNLVMARMIGSIALHLCDIKKLMKILYILLFFVFLEAHAEMCSPEGERPCSIEVENILPPGKPYKLEIIEAMLVVEKSSNGDATGYWGANGSYPTTYIEKLSLTVENSKFWIPTKAYSDLGNISMAEVKENQHAIVLIVRGGQASDSYYATFVFIDGKMRKRTVRSVALPDQLWEKTTFHGPTS
ncbi:MAG: hypothetical protein ACI8XC_000487 [Gammaproteobacteria bacterium]